MIDPNQEREGLAWQTGVWNRISSIYLREIDRRFEPVVDALLRRAALRTGELVLDLGTGTGSVARRAAAAIGPSGRAVGVDISPEMLALARHSAVSLDFGNLTFLEGRAEAIPAEDAAFDVALASLSFGRRFRAVSADGKGQTESLRAGRWRSYACTNDDRRFARRDSDIAAQ